MSQVSAAALLEWCVNDRAVMLAWRLVSLYNGRGNPDTENEIL